MNCLAMPCHANSAGYCWKCSASTEPKPQPEMPPANSFNFDAIAAFNIRNWLREACEAKGAKFTGGGVGFGGADLDIEIEGCAFNIFIKPIMR